MAQTKSPTMFAMAALLLAFGPGPVLGQAGRADALVNRDLASEKELLALPHVTAAIVKGIMERRPFANIGELNMLLAQSLGKEQLAELYGKLFVQINLNAAKDDEILLIPGLGDRMLREFKEYRPYTNIEQFRKEIGKYVDKKEVARLERYVTLN